MSTPHTLEQNRYAAELVSHGRDIDALLAKYPADVREFMRAQFRLDMYPLGFTQAFADQLNGFRRAIAWNPLPDRPYPLPGVPVLVTLDMAQPMVRVATWQPRFTMPLHTDAGGEGEWDEETEMEYAPEGWYIADLPDNEEPIWRINYPVRAWARLPEPWA